MAKNTDQRDDLNDDDEDDETVDDLNLDLDDDEDDEEDQSDESDESNESGNEKKRVKDLQSAKDKETARANKAEAELAKMREALSKGQKSKDDGTQAVVPPEVQRWLNAAKESTRTRLYESDPRFKEYGLAPTLISGESPEDMEASFNQLKRLVGKVESRVRNAVLREHGFAEAPSGTTATPKRNYANMGQADFEKLVADALK